MRLIHRLYLAFWAFKHWRALVLLRDELNEEAKVKNSHGRNTALSYNAGRWAGLLSF